MYCENWSKQMEKKHGYTDALNVMINDMEFAIFMSN